MKSFIELFTDARAVGTPFVAVRTFDPLSTIANVTASLDDAMITPRIVWDSIHGLKGLGDVNNMGSQKLQSMATLAGVELGASVDLPIALGILEFAGEDDLIVFIHNPHLIWSSDSKVIQGIANLRTLFKANGNMLVLMYGAGDELPTELQQDVLILEEPLPTTEELAVIIEEVYSQSAQNPKYTACKTPPNAAVIKAACEAGIGLPAFPFEQSVAMSLDKENGVLDIAQLWDRKRSIVSSRRGMTFLQPKETLADMYGNKGFSAFATRYMESEYAPNVILRVDEIQRAFAGNETDSSGSTGKQMGEFLTWVEDNEVVCTLLLGVPGSSKSWSSICIAGHYHKPLIKFDLAAMEDKLVGEGGKILRENERVVESTSDKKIWLIATANSLRGLPPELISRFQVGGIFFFDAPDTEEKIGIMKLKIAKYGLKDQPLPEMEGWTGRDINNCARKAQFLNCALTDAAKFVVPLMKSHHEDMDALRQSAHDRFLSASHEGVYQYEPPPVKTVVHTPVVNAGRKIR